MLGGSRAFLEISEKSNPSVTKKKKIESERAGKGGKNNREHQIKTFRDQVPRVQEEVNKEKKKSNRGDLFLTAAPRPQLSPTTKTNCFDVSVAVLSQTTSAVIQHLPQLETRTA